MMPPVMQAPAVRRIRADEGILWRALRLRALADTPIAFIDTVGQASLRPDADWDAAAATHSTGCGSALFIAERAGDWVGVAGGFADDAGATTVFTVFVEPAARGQRVLEALLGAVTAWSVSCGRSTLTLEVAAQNLRAVAAYRRLGFTETGRARRHPLYREVTEIEMTRPAANPPSQLP